MLFSIVENQRTSYKSMKDVEQLNYSINEHMKRIKEFCEGKKIMQLFQIMSEYSVKFSGVSYMNNRTMAGKLKCSIRTIQRYTKKLEELSVLLKIPTFRKSNSRTSNTYIILPVLKRLSWGCHDLNPSMNLKQESNYLIKNQFENELSDSKIVEYIKNRVNDSLKKGTKIKYLSSYIDRIVRSLENQALYNEQLRQKKAQQEREQQQSQQLRETLNGKVSIPFYNWLEE